ncbi:MAG: methionyl-tRNA formyltransferase [Thiolinea sp.]
MTAVLRVVYAGTPDFAVPALRSLLSSRHQVVAVYTQPDRPAGRGRKIKPGPVKQLALDNEVPVEQPLSFRDSSVMKTLEDYQADVMVVAAYGLILPQRVLDTPGYGCLNIHGSLLPRWRGAAPIQRAIQAGDAETGVTIMQMAAGLDTGDMLLKVVCPISPEDGGQSIHDHLAEAGADALLQTLDLLCEGKLQPEVQNESQACYAHKLSKAEAEIDWSQPAVVIDRQIRAFDAWPTAFSYYQGKPVRFFSSLVPNTDSLTTVSTEVAEGADSILPGTVVAESRDGIDVMAGDQALVRITSLQMAGGKRMSVADFVNARSLADIIFESSQVSRDKETDA